MIYALIMRRLWLWQNRLIPSLFLLMILPICVYLLISLPFKNIILTSLSGVPYELWVIPGVIFIVSSLGMFPLLYRDFFDLRIHKKVLSKVALAPFRKRVIIFGYLVVSGFEALLFGIIALMMLSGIASFPLSIIETIVMLLCLILYLFILGNFYITLGLLVETVTTLILLITIVFLFIVFGNGYVIEFGFFPVTLEFVLSWQPFAIPYRIFQTYLEIGIMDWALFITLLILGALWTLMNTTILKKRLLH